MLTLHTFKEKLLCHIKEKVCHWHRHASCWYVLVILRWGTSQMKALSFSREPRPLLTPRPRLKTKVSCFSCREIKDVKRHKQQKKRRYTLVEEHGKKRSSRWCSGRPNVRPWQWKHLWNTIEHNESHLAFVLTRGYLNLSLIQLSNADTVGRRLESLC